MKNFKTKTKLSDTKQIKKFKQFIEKFIINFTSVLKKVL